ncbi:glycerophosphodiester phosphodiesterase family protein [Peteryoungia ipomoeae]|uniref:Glycerophosphodiester phosphodiesterase family protein n=1 Tax=Peteryoungia ipomoeae TaxID=1210932 RepID=A0A4S8P7U8_9HYPH|nr:glycerophosphodiester phosphodiesterase family protein [Peteryoungia ipomoeae]THV23829.1 glycerophosphodiester phosphodiesterase family protein [Peteryoungia ipomoeae]
MRFIVLLGCLMFALVASASHAPLPGGGRTELIHARLTRANDWRDHVMVVAHRAGWKENGRIVRAENSFDAIDHAAATGVEMVELDVRRSSDGVLVIMHDATLERTTTCHGPVAERSLASLRQCKLVIEDTRRETGEQVFTLEEALLHARGRVMINIDNKLEPEALVEIADLATRLGMTDAILLKMPVWNAERLQIARDIRRAIAPKIAFMPIIADDGVIDPAFLDHIQAQLSAPAAELIHWHREAGKPITPDGGPLLSPVSRAVAIRNNAHLWINTYPITDRPEGMVAGGRGDYLALSGDRPNDVWGFFVERGITIIQTDEPDAVIAYLDGQGLRRPYDLIN